MEEVHSVIPLESEVPMAIPCPYPPGLAIPFRKVLDAGLGLPRSCGLPGRSNELALFDSKVVQERTSVHYYRLDAGGPVFLVHRGVRTVAAFLHQRALHYLVGKPSAGTDQEFLT